MTEFEFKNKQYQLKEVTYGQWRRVLKLRKQATETKDEYLLMEALGVWLKTATNITDVDLDSFTLTEAMAFAQKIGEIQTIPLQPKERLEEQSYQEIPV